MKDKIKTQFSDWLINKNLCGKTISEYTRRIDIFLIFINNDIGNISEMVISNWFLELRKRYKASEINLFRSALINFLRFIGKDNIPIPNQIKLEIKMPDSISEEYFHDNVLPMVDLTFKNAIQVKAILYLMFYHGLRNKEVPNLKRANFDLEKYRLKIEKTKTKRERIIPLSKKTTEIIKLYFTLYQEKNNAFNVGVSGITYIFDKLKPCFKDIHFRPLLFRHSCATHLLLQGLDISDVSKILGHSNITTTLRYLDFNIDNLQKKFDRFIK